MEALAQGVLFPLSLEMHLNAIKGKKFSIATDASNKGNVKMFPIAIQYFDIKSGINNFVIDFYEDSNEKSEGIYRHLIETLKQNKISIDNMMAFTGDNASVNYGVNHSV